GDLACADASGTGTAASNFAPPAGAAKDARRALAVSAAAGSTALMTSRTMSFCVAMANSGPFWFQFVESNMTKQACGRLTCDPRWCARWLRADPFRQPGALPCG